MDVCQQSSFDGGNSTVVRLVTLCRISFLGSCPAKVADAYSFNYGITG